MEGSHGYDGIILHQKSVSYRIVYMRITINTEASNWVNEVLSINNRIPFILSSYVKCSLCKPRYAYVGHKNVSVMHEGHEV
jgi:hypothetical protein